MKKISGILLLLFILSCTASQPKVFRSVNEYYHFFEWYYLNPQPEKVIHAIQYYVNSSYYSQENARFPSAHFYAAILNENPSLITDYIQNLANASDDERWFGIQVFRRLRDHNGVEVLHKIDQVWSKQEITPKNEQRLLKPALNILIAPVVRPVTLDNLWAVFYATGSEVAIQKLISILHFIDDGFGEEMILGNAAKWSLESNAKNHKRVIDVIKESIPTADSITKKHIQDILNKTT